MKKLTCAVLAIVLLFGTCACGRKNKTVKNRKGKNIYFDTTAAPYSPKETLTPGEEPTPVPTMAPPKFSGQAFCVMNAENGEVVYEQNSREVKYIASITKLLTALTALDYLEPDETVTIRNEWLKLLKSDPSIECYGMKDGQKYTVNDVITMALIKSFGDAAEVLRGATEEKTGEDFLKLMNDKAQEIGMEQSHFDNTIGLDIGNNFKENYSTAEDAALLLSMAMKNETIVNACCGKKVTLTDGKTLTHGNTLLSKGTGYDDYEVVCGKTGATNASGYSLAFGVKDPATNTRYAIIYLHGPKSWNTVNTEISEIAEYVINYLCD